MSSTAGKIMREGAMMINDLVENSVIVEKIYGFWPSFHDSNLIEFNLKFLKNNIYTADAALKIMYKGQDAPDGNKNSLNCIITFLCRNISSSKIDFSNLHGGAWIDEIEITQKDGLIFFDIRPLAGVDIQFYCVSVKIEEIYFVENISA